MVAVRQLCDQVVAGFRRILQYSSSEKSPTTARNTRDAAAEIDCTLEENHKLEADLARRVISNRGGKLNVKHILALLRLPRERARKSPSERQVPLRNGSIRD